jgi:hypothetical protein
MATIEPKPEEAFVHVDFLSRFSQDETLTIAHPAEERVLWDLCCVLEKQVVELFEPDYATKLAAARTRVADGDWE